MSLAEATELSYSKSCTCCWATDPLALPSDGRPSDWHYEKSCRELNFAVIAFSVKNWKSVPSRSTPRPSSSSSSETFSGQESGLFVCRWTRLK